MSAAADGILALKTLESMKALGRRLAYIVGAAAVLFGAGYWIGGRRHAATLDATLVRQQATYATDSAAHVAAIAHTDSQLVRSDRHVADSQRADSGWSDARRLAATVPTLIASSAPDAAKIAGLARVVHDLTVAGDSLRASNDSLRADLTRVHASLLDERAAAAKRLADAAAMLQTSEEETASARRRWGLGCTAGYGGVISAGRPAVGPGAACGVTYRW